MATRLEIALAATALDPAPVWTDAGRVIGCNIRRGRRAGEGGLQPGSAGVTIDDPEFKLDPVNTASPWAASLVPNRQVRITHILDDATVETLFTGFLDETEMASYRPPVATLRAVDGLGWLGAQRAVQDEYGAAVLALAPTAYWRMNEAVGATTLRDAGPTGSHLTTLGTLTRMPYTPAPSALVGHPDQAIDMAAGGAVGQTCAYAPAGFSPLNLADFTLEFWFRTADQLPADIAIYQTAVGNPNVGQLLIAVSRLGQPYVVYIPNGGGASTFLTHAAVVADGQWHHICWTRTGTTHGLRVDGGPSTTGVLPATPAPAAGVVTPFGAGPYWLDEVALYPSVLEVATTANNYHIGRNRWGTLTGGQLSGARVGIVLDQLDWPVARRAIDAGVEPIMCPTVEQAPALLDQSALAHLEAVAATEEGLLFATRAGSIAFYGRTAVGGALTQTAYNDTVVTAIADGWRVDPTGTAAHGHAHGIILTTPSTQPAWVVALEVRHIGATPTTLVVGSRGGGAAEAAWSKAVTTTADWQRVTLAVPLTGQPTAGVQVVEAAGGVVVFEVRNVVMVGAPLYTGGSTGGLRVTSVRPTKRRADLINHAEATRPGGTVQVVDNFPDQADGGRADAPNRDGLWVTDLAAFNAAVRTVTDGTPRVRIPTLTMNARIGTPETVACAQAELGALIVVLTRGHAIAAQITGITHHIDTGRRWTVTYDLRS